MANVTHLPKKGYLPFVYRWPNPNMTAFSAIEPTKARLDELYEDFPEGFPEAFPWGYALYGLTDLSIKQGHPRKVGQITVNRVL